MRKMAKSQSISIACRKRNDNRELLPTGILQSSIFQWDSSIVFCSTMFKQTLQWRQQEEAPDRSACFRPLLLSRIKNKSLKAILEHKGIALEYHLEICTISNHYSEIFIYPFPESRVDNVKHFDT